MWVATMSLLGKQKQQQALNKSLLGRLMGVTTLSLLGKQKQQQALTKGLLGRPMWVTMLSLLGKHPGIGRRYMSMVKMEFLGIRHRACVREFTM